MSKIIKKIKIKCILAVVLAYLCQNSPSLLQIILYKKFKLIIGILKTWIIKKYLLLNQVFRLHCKILFLK